MFDLSKKTALAITIVAVILIVAIGAVVIYVSNLYNSTPYSRVFEAKGELTTKNSMLVAVSPESGEPDTGADAYYFDTLTGEFALCQPKTLSLEGYGFEGEINYYTFINQSKSLLFPMYGYFKTFASLISPASLPYIDGDGKKYILNPNLTGDAQKPSPLFSGSYANKDIYGTQIEAFSTDGTTGAGMTADKSAILISYINTVNLGDFVGDDEYSLSSLMIQDAKLKFFVNSRYLWLSALSPEGFRNYYVFDSQDGKLAECPRPEGAAFTETLFADYYAELPFSTEGDSEKDKYIYCRFYNAVTGAETKTAFDKERFTSLKLLAVGNKGGHAIIEAQNTDGSTEKFVCAMKDNGRGTRALLSLCVPEGETLLKASFLYDNFLLLTLERADKTVYTVSYKVNF